MRGFVVLVMCGVLTACGGGGSPEPTASPTPPPSPATTTRPTQDLTYSAGSADVSVTGAETATFTVDLDTTEATYSKESGFDVWWRSGGQALNLAGDVKNGEADVFVRVETATGAFVDPFHTLCDVTVTTYDDTSLAGRFTCEELMLWGGDESQAEAKPLSAGGTFSATVSPQASPSS